MTTVMEEQDTMICQVNIPVADQYDKDNDNVDNEVGVLDTSIEMSEPEDLQQQEQQQQLSPHSVCSAATATSSSDHHHHLHHDRCHGELFFISKPGATLTPATSKTCTSSSANSTPSSLASSSSTFYSSFSSKQQQQQQRGRRTSYLNVRRSVITTTNTSSLVSSSASSNNNNNNTPKSTTKTSWTPTSFASSHRNSSTSSSSSSSFGTATTTTAATTTSVWVPLPSPSRPKIDPRYVARLAPELRPSPKSSSPFASASTTQNNNNHNSPSPRFQQQHHHQHQEPSSALYNKDGKSATETTHDDDDDDNHNDHNNGDNMLMPPPGIARCEHASYMFRPTPISIPTTTSPTTMMDYVLSSTATTSESPGRRRRFFPPSPLSSNQQQKQHQPRPLSSYYTYSPRSCRSAGGTATSTTPTTTTTTTSWTPSTHKRTASDVGVSDRFIPSRATSNFSFSLWEPVQHGVRTPSRRGFANNDSSTNTTTATGRSNDATMTTTTTMGTTSHAAGTATTTTPTTTSGTGAAVAEDTMDAGTTASSTTPTMSTTSLHAQQNLLNTLLRSELLGENENPVNDASLSSPPPRLPPHAVPFREGSMMNLASPHSHYLRYQSPRQQYQENMFDEAVVGPTAVVNSFSLTAVKSAASQRLMAAPPKRKRRISKVPFKVLDAPALQDDFYLNLVDWSSQNVLAVGLGCCVYLWSACTSKVTKLCDLSASDDVVTSVSWAQRGTHLSVGTNRGQVQLWDTIKCKRVRSMDGHNGRVGALAWTGPILASGSRDRLIYLRDVRVQASYTDKLSHHHQEVCGLKWSFDEPSFLASGGNDNNLHVIDSRNPMNPIHKFGQHTAAVKAIAWSPHQHGLLASGGGTADRCIRFWNTLSGSALNKVDTGSQVCNLAWSHNCNEIVSTHGYSLNQIVVWRYPSMNKVVTLTGHTYRVLYLAMSPDGSTVVTGAGDETLRFWQIFPGPRSDGKDGSGGILFPNTIGSVIR